MTLRRTIVVHTKLSGHMIRVDAARSGANGVQVMTMGQLAGRIFEVSYAPACRWMTKPVLSAGRGERVAWYRAGTKCGVWPAGRSALHPGLYLRRRFP